MTTQSPAEPELASTPSAPTLAAWIPNFEARFASMDEWWAMFSQLAATAAKAGSTMLVLPEYMSECWLSFCPPERAKPKTDQWLLEQGNIALPRIAELAKSLNMIIVAGTMLLKGEDGQWRNRCSIFLPDGRHEFQDKLCMMPTERSKVGLLPGDTLRVFEHQGLRFAVLICLDIQNPRLASQLIEKSPDLLIVPAQTMYRSGFTRVFRCAAARAVELHCPVLTTGGVGTITIRGESEPNTGGAELFLPAEAKFGYDGKRHGLGPFAHLEPREGLLYIAPAVPVAACREDRANTRCEAWHPVNHARTLDVIDA
jgi:predicted amidohydrolase